MYKLILVDDEEEVRKGLLEKIDWNKHGFEIAGEAENGIEALEVAEKTLPDVVITDIKMPFMDGLTLSRKIMDKFPTSKIIILTGFDEFEYAHQAIKLDVVEYILKPVSSSEVIEMLEVLRKKLDKEIAEKKNIEILKDHYNKSIPILREKFLESLISNRLNNSEIINKFDAYGIEFHGTKFAAAVLNIEFNSPPKDFRFQEDSLNTCSSDVFLSKDKEIVKVAILNISEQIIKKHNCGIVFLHNDDIVIIFTFSDVEKHMIMQNIFSVLEEIQQCIKKYYEIVAVIGLGTLCSDISDITYSYQDAVKALDYKMILCNNSIICIEDMEPKSTKEIIFDEIKERSLVSCVKVGTTQEIINTLNELFKDLIDAATSFKDYQIYLLEMLTAILKAARDLNVDINNIFGSNYNLFVELYKFKNISQVKDWMIQICIKIKNYVSQGRVDSSKLLVKKAKEYIQNSYNECDITIDKVCRHLHISPTYFSTIFKKETKFTFVNYLTHIRMEASKELLRSTDFKTFEIAKMVGYSEPNYFSYCFKKNFNLSPSEYRKNHKSSKGE